MRRPGNCVDAGLVALKLNDGQSREADIEHHYLGAVHDYGSHVPGVLFVPPEPHKRGFSGVGGLVDDGGVLLITEVENADGSVGGDGGEDADAAPGDVVDLLVVGNELGVYSLAFDVPDGAGGVDGGGADATGLRLVPVEGGEWSAELRVLVAIEEGLEFDAVIVDTPQPEEVGRGGQKVLADAVAVGDEHGFSGRVGVLKGERGVGADVACGIVKLDDLDTVLVLLHEAGNGEAVLLVPANAPVHSVDVPWRLVRVDLRSLLLLLRPLRRSLAAAATTAAAAIAPHLYLSLSSNSKAFRFSGTCNAIWTKLARP
ncbi:hypothetical protein IHE45_10G001400 [Dioscorea alata]|uniref:Uncharacterized protein n=1 Tax=Dioscorea alata TaxID=55571 RepID=A0ACB7V8Y8_DIOAL|nr:hypothetical protein IHE45_10G001400 [Dioscorea alata]